MISRLVIALFWIGTAGALSASWTSVAVDNLGNEEAQPFLITAEGNIEFEHPTLPPEIKKAVYGKVIRLSYTALNASDQYRIELRFFSNDAPRTQEVWINGAKQAVLTLLPHQEERSLLDIPPELSNRGELTVEIRIKEGVNAVLSRVELFSTGTQRPTPLEDVSGQFVEIDYPIPRLSPLPADPSLLLSLDGEWQFRPTFEKELITSPQKAKWGAISVPGQWSLQGYEVPKNKAAAYYKSFTLPQAWRQKRLKLRFDAVYSEAVVYLNGQQVGTHQGGFTPFELDVTAGARFDQANTLVVSVKNESFADQLSSGSRYAAHPLGGITRSAFVAALPPVNLSRLSIQTRFDQADRDAHLVLKTELQNESDEPSGPLRIVYELAKWPAGTPQEILTLQDVAVAPGQSHRCESTILIQNPDQWNCETPSLYTLTCTLWKGDQVLERIEERFGFREIEVRGNEVWINNRPVKFRGVNRHEVHPRTGRSLAKSWYSKDVSLFREANVNLIRTAHYPPDKALMEAADELGMFIECEAPFCWVFRGLNANPKTVEQVVKQSLEMVEYFKNHPSIIYWSVANESHWIPAFESAQRQIKALDPSRPTTFNWHPGPLSQREDHCAIGSIHYPGYALSPYEQVERPVSCGEFAHLNAYNRYELATDVALRDSWGRFFHRQWELMYKTKGIVGGSLWAGIDDTFYWDYKKPDGSVEARTVGYGTWGPLDGWRRKKPEWWSMKKVFSPVRCRLTNETAKFLELEIENRQDFSPLSRLAISWTLGNRHGVLESDLAPKEKTSFQIPREPHPAAPSPLHLIVRDPRGFVVDEYRFALSSPGSPPATEAFPSVRYQVLEHPSHFEVRGENAASYHIDRQTGMIRHAEFTGPSLMILPLKSEGETKMEGPTKFYGAYNPLCGSWRASKVTLLPSSPHSPGPTFEVKGAYQEAEGRYSYTFLPEGKLQIAYNFTVKEDVNPRQIGLVFEVQTPTKSLHWRRKGYWSVYPPWHIARLEGTALKEAGVATTPVGPRTFPTHEWRHDRGPGGNHDFASTKHHIYEATLTSHHGSRLTVWAEADRHVRAWEDQDHVKLLVANYSNGGAERFLRTLVRGEERPLKKGDRLTGDVVLRVYPARK